MFIMNGGQINRPQPVIPQVYVSALKAASKDVPVLPVVLTLSAAILSHSRFAYKTVRGIFSHREGFGDTFEQVINTERLF